MRVAGARVTLGAVPQRTDTFDVGRLGLAAGEGRRFTLDVAIEPLTFGGATYAAAGGFVTATLDAERTTRGFALRLRYETTLEGPCMRCLEVARTPVAIDAREIDQPGGGEELRSPYLQDELLDVASWARDALALEVPHRIVCSEECRGLCPECGANLNQVGPDHRHERAPDPRWAVLRELRFD